MIFNVTFAYSAEVRRKRKRGAASETFVATIAVSVPELGDAEAPVVARYDLPMSLQEKYANPSRPRVRQELRFSDGKLFAPHRLKSGIDGHDDTPLDAAWLADIVVSGKVAWPNPFAPVSRHYAVKTMEESMGDISEVMSSERENSANLAREIASNLALIDGRLWKSMPEPRLWLESRWEQDADETKFYVNVLPARGPDKDDLHRVYPHSVYSLLQEDYLREVLARYPEDMNVRMVGANVEILDPMAFRMKADEQAMAYAARRLLGSIAKETSDATVEQFVAYAALRDALPAFEASARASEECDARNFAQILREAIDAWPDKILGAEASRSINRWTENNVDQELASAFGM